MCVKTSVICAKTTETSKQTGRTSDGMKVLCSRVGSNCSRMSAPGLVPHNSNRIGRMFRQTERTCGVIAGTCGATNKIGGPIAEISDRIGRMFGRIEAIYSKIARTFVRTGRTSKAIERSGLAGADRA